MTEDCNTRWSLFPSSLSKAELKNCKMATVVEVNVERWSDGRCGVGMVWILEYPLTMTTRQTATCFYMISGRNRFISLAGGLGRMEPMDLRPSISHSLLLPSNDNYHDAFIIRLSLSDDLRFHPFEKVCFIKQQFESSTLCNDHGTVQHKTDTPACLCSFEISLDTPPFLFTTDYPKYPIGDIKDWLTGVSSLFLRICCICTQDYITTVCLLYRNCGNQKKKVFSNRVRYDLVERKKEIIE